MTSAVTSYGQPVSAGTRKLNLKLFNVGLFAIIAGLGLYYLVNISNLTVMGFELRELKEEAAALARNKLAKEEEVNRVRSYQALSSRTKNLDMVAVGDVEYLTISGAAVARK